MQEKLDFSCHFYYKGFIPVNVIITDPTSKVTVFRDSPEHLVKEGDSVEIRCEGDGNPQPVKTFTHNNVRSLLFKKCCNSNQSILQFYSIVVGQGS